MLTSRQLLFRLSILYLLLGWQFRCSESTSSWLCSDLPRRRHDRCTERHMIVKRMSAVTFADIGSTFF